MMLGSSARCGHMKCFYGFCSQHQINNCAVQNFAKCYQRVCVRNYAKGGKDPHDCHGCCKDIEKTSSTRVEPWPRPDTTPVPWRNECPQGPPPPNYDPYRIKVPDIEVPPLPPSNAKCGVLAYQRQPGSFGQEEQNPGFGDQYPQQQYDEHGNPLPADDSSGGLLGKIKGFFKRKKKTHDEYPYTQIVSCPGGGVPDIQWKMVRDMVQTSSDVGDVLSPENVDHEADAAPTPRLCYHGMTKYKMAFHEPWKPLDRLTLLAEAEKEAKENEVRLKHKDKGYAATTLKLK